MLRVARNAASHFGYGWSAEEITCQYPHLTPAEVHAALGDYFDNRDEIDGKPTTELGEFDRDRKHPAIHSARAARRNWTRGQHFNRLL